MIYKIFGITFLTYTMSSLGYVIYYTNKRWDEYESVNKEKDLLYKYLYNNL